MTTSPPTKNLAPAGGVQPLSGGTIAYRPYRLGFASPLKTARGVLAERQGILLKVTLAEQNVYADLLPLEHFGTESLSDALQYLKKVTPTAPVHFEEVPAGLPATRCALEMAQIELQRPSPLSAPVRNVMPVAKLMLLDEAVRSGLQQEIVAGYSTFKFKIGLSDFEQEFGLLQRIAAEIPEGCRFRLDANEGLSRELAARWLGAIDSLPVEFLEQPLPRTHVDETIRLAEEFATEIALDESIATTADAIRCYEAGFRGVFSIKPLRLLEIQKFLDWRGTSQAKVSYSTVFESAVGTVFGMKLAAGDGRNSYALGYGVSHWYKESRLIFPVSSAVNASTLLAWDAEHIWQLLA